ncbi:MAG: Tol-Pal system beta propeller repeat protein TolB [Gammaproteobacteria bacterium HGW-Gammaproteobacteria-1]|jgi:TolB protein|nr:MAG: Tol-Pal system beta propeller repeat protein TolB [Gammaproteobacteria bacterium HGW-Gammaproteobacteria-1]
MKTLLLCCLLLAGTAQARLSIEITQGMEGAMPIAVVPFGWSGAGGVPAEDVAAIISADLARSGQFAPLDVQGLPQRPVDGRDVNFNLWRGAGSDNLVIGRVELRDGRYQVQFQLFDAVRGVQLAGYSLQTDATRLRRVAHQIADIIFQRLTGQRGAFDTHIAYVTVENLEAGKRRFRLEVADADGHNEQVILTSGQPLLSPAWAPDGRRLAYVSFEDGRSMIYLQDIASGNRQKVAEFSGLNSAPEFSPDGRRLALTLSRDGNPEIYVLELAGGRLARVTQHFAIDTEPVWTADGRGLYFTSDRGGRPQIYRVQIDDGGRPLGSPQRVTFEGSYNASPALSADGKRLAMVHGDGKRYRVAVLELDSSTLRVLTDTRQDESPSFAPNGTMVLYATEVGDRGVLEAVSADGRARQRLGLKKGDVREPAWSPFFGE